MDFYIVYQSNTFRVGTTSVYGQRVNYTASYVEKLITFEHRVCMMQIQGLSKVVPAEDSYES